MSYRDPDAEWCGGDPGLENSFDGRCYGTRKMNRSGPWETVGAIPRWQRAKKVKSQCSVLIETIKRDV